MGTLAGHWTVDLEFLRGGARHAMELQQEGDEVKGRYRSQYGEQEISGRVDGSRVELRTGVHYQACGAGYAFEGTVDGDQMQGALSLGEYWTARWRARRVA